MAEGFLQPRVPVQRAWGNHSDAPAKSSQASTLLDSCDPRPDTVNFDSLGRSPTAADIRGISLSPSSLKTLAGWTEEANSIFLLDGQSRLFSKDPSAVFSLSSGQVSLCGWLLDPQGA